MPAPAVKTSASAARSAATAGAIQAGASAPAAAAIATTQKRLVELGYRCTGVRAIQKALADRTRARARMLIRFRELQEKARPVRRVFLSTEMRCTALLLALVASQLAIL